MCTIIKPLDEPVLLNKDLEVYKLVYKNDFSYTSFFIGARIEFDTLLTTTMNVVDNIYTIPVVPSLCSEEDKAYESKAGSKYCKVVEMGFHSFTSLKIDFLKGRHYIARCIIPAGSLVYYGYYDNIVSNQIIYKEIVNQKCAQ